ncbi:MAG TPA: glycoside hydrolase family 78 protein [Candidatus Mediterraneibacter cottocaccae]|nr:glycoside hydrolase family 78 protein [Candidatus Mediterraneibacter cottocaccae]
MIHITDLKCEHMVHPMAVETQSPRFSWKLESGERNVYQESYRICVEKRSGGEVWDSGRVKSAAQSEIEYAGEALESACGYRFRVTVWTESGMEAESADAEFETGFFHAADWKAVWIEPDPLPQLPVNPLTGAQKKWGEFVQAMMRGEQVDMLSDEANLRSNGLEPYDPPVRMRRLFPVKDGAKRARLYITAHGIYDVRINGKAVTDTLLNPGFTTYDKRIRYQAYPAETLLKEGENAIAVTVADGWYKGKIALGRGCEYGETPGLLAQLEIEYADGTEETVCTDGEWKYSFDGPVRMADLFLGETVDARRDMQDPSDIDYPAAQEDAAFWKPVRTKGGIGERYVKQGEKDSGSAPYAFPIPEGQNFPPAKVLEEFPAKKVWTAPNGDILADFGQNLAGVIRAVIRGEAGETVTFEHGEVLDPDGNFTYAFEGDETRAQRDTYICAGSGEEVFSPRFTYHGFRYVRMKGGSDWKAERLTALAIGTDNKVTGSFSCSDGELNQLQHNIFQSQRSNNITIPTDCPTREKAGWTGDVVVYGATAMYNQDMTAFYEDWLKSIRAEQNGNGHVLNTVPLIKNYVQQTAAGSLGWGDVILTLPMQLYRLMGDKKVLTDNYEAMGKWMDAMRLAAAELPVNSPFGGMTREEFDSLSERRKENQKYVINTGFHFGDWLVPSVRDANGFSDGPASSFLTMNCVDTALLAADADMYADVSELLGHKDTAEEYRTYAGRVRQAFYEEFVCEGKLTQEMQGNYILALKYNMIPEEERPAFAARLDQMIHENNDRLDTGFMSVAHILDVLCDSGCRDTAWKVLWQKRCPSWLYEVEHGATTMWENWDAIREDGAVCGCSFNHYAFGCVGDFLYRRILGIQNEGTGYDRIRIAPLYDCGLKFAEGSLDTPCGIVHVRWEKCGEKVSLQGEIPANADAVVVLPDGNERRAGNGRFAF